MECDIRKESMGAKIKDARNMRIPFMAVVGDKEMQNNTFSIRSRREDQLGEMDLATFVKNYRMTLKISCKRAILKLVNNFSEK